MIHKALTPTEYRKHAEALLKVTDVVIPNERNRRIVEEILRGDPFSTVGKRHKINPQTARIQFIKNCHRCWEYIKGKETNNEGFALMSVRARNALKDAGIWSIGELKEHWSQHGDTYLIRTPNCGRTTLSEIRNAAGFPEEINQGRKLKPVSEERYQQALRLVQRYESENKTNTEQET